MSSQVSITAEQARQLILDWKSNSELRAEFNNDFDVYAAYQRGVASGRIKDRKEISISNAAIG